MTLTCISCRVAFESSEAQREHYKTEFHRFNLKRKVAGLPPVTHQAFEEKISAVRQEDSKTKIQFNTFCPYCDKTYRTQKAFEQHCSSKKHLENKAASPDDQGDLLPVRTEKKTGKNNNPTDEKIETENQSQNDEKSKETEEKKELTEEELVEEHLKKGVLLELEQCIFCNLKHSTFEEALEHMAKEHGLFIPDIEYVSDLQGLVTYLSRKVSFGLTCLYCPSGKVYGSLQAVQSHMASKCHCKIRYETEEDQEEFDEFYDYSPSHSTESNQTSIETFEKMKANQFSAEDLDSNPYSLSLPTGKVIGHRNLALYYKQKPRPNETRDSIVFSRLLTHYDSMGWTNRNEQQLIQKQERQIKRRQNKSYERLGIKANKLQPYFRQATP